MNTREPIITLDDAIDGLAAAAVFLAGLPMNTKARAALAAVDRAIDLLEAQHEAQERMADDLQNVLQSTHASAYSWGLAGAAGGRDEAVNALACQNAQLAHENQILRQKLAGRWPGLPVAEHAE